jgi:predicted porin
MVALAAMGVAGVALAQSSVTLFGVVDAAVSEYRNKSDNVLGGSATARLTALTPSGYNASRLGFRGTEDLGGGLASGFWLEAGINNDDGTGQKLPGVDAASNGGGALTFNRRTTVSLSGLFGELRLGRDYTPTYWNDNVFDPFGPNGVGTNLISTANGFSSSGAATNGFPANPNYARASNSIGYFLPANLGGFYGQLMYAFNEKSKYDPGGVTPNVLNNSRAGRYVGGRVGYANRRLDVATAYGSTTIADAFYAGLTTNLNTFNIGASYDFGPVKLSGEYSMVKRDTQNDGFVPIGAFNADPSGRGWLLGAAVPVGPGLIRLAYSAVQIDRKVLQSGNDPKADKVALGYVYNLSKRTALYTTLARINNKNGYDLILGGPNFVSKVTGVPGVYTPKSSTGYDFGLRHAF